MRIGDRVEHPKFGFGRVLEITGKTALVEWDTHRVTREFDRPGRTPLDKHHSHVNIPMLKVVSAAMPS
jgi:hypothetical protein